MENAITSYQTPKLFHKIMDPIQQISIGANTDPIKQRGYLSFRFSPII